MIEQLFKSFLSWLRRTLGFDRNRKTGIVTVPCPGSENTHKVAPQQIRSNSTPSELRPANNNKNVPDPSTSPPSDAYEETPSEAVSPGSSDIETTSEILNGRQVPSVTEVSKLGASAITQEASTEESKNHRKPYKKKAPTEKPPRSPQRGPANGQPTRKKSTFLGGGGRPGRNKTSYTDASEPLESRTIDVKHPSDAEKDLSILSPFIEISLNGVIVNLVFPEQVIRVNADDQPVQISYNVHFNGEKRQVTASVSQRADGIAIVQRTEMLLDNPLKALRITYPLVLNEETFDYKHINTSFYLFRAIGNDQGRMFWLFDEQGNPNPLPKRNFWLLIHEDLQIEEPSPTLIDEQWVWNHYKPCLIDLRQTNVLRTRSKGSQIIIALDAVRSFQIESESLIQDDFRYESPLFSGRAISIRAPHTNERGWAVWISTKDHSAHLLQADWTGEEPVVLDCPSHLPAPFGEFQVDICPTGSRIAEETLFFRWFPWLALDCKRDLIFPDPHKGHTPTQIHVRLTEPDRWSVSSEKIDPLRTNDSAYFFDLPPEHDTVRMTISEHNAAKARITITLTSPRVKWRTSDTDTWYAASRTVQREQFVTGKHVALIVRTNDLFRTYQLTAILCIGDQHFQTERMIKNGLYYVIALNRFFDTVAANPEVLYISVEVRNDDGDRNLLGIIKTVVISRKTIERGSNSEVNRTRKRIPRQLCQAQVKCSGIAHKRKPGKGFSKKEVETAGLAFSKIRESKLVPIDKRRKSCHQWNVEALLSVKLDQKPMR